MTTSRFDALLAQALATGTIPAEATAAERGELEPLLRTGAILEQAGATAAEEASTAMPIARARFERFLAAQAETAAAPAVATFPPRLGFFGRLIHANRGLLLAGGAVAIGLLAVVAVLGSQSFLTGTDTADAQVLTPDDFVQVQGVVSSVSLSNGVRTVTLQSEFGNVSIVLSDQTSIVEDQADAAPNLIAAGDRVLVGGIVGTDRSISAQTIAVTAMQTAPPKQSKAQQLKKLLPNLAGRVVLLAVANDGQSAHVLIEAANGKRYNIDVDAATAARLLTASSTVLGTNVSVNEGATPNDSIFGLTLSGPAATTPVAGSTPSTSAAGCPLVAAARDGFAGVCGVIVARDSNVLSVVDSSGQVHRVVIRATTRILLGESGLTVKSIRQGDTVIGHTIVVSGGLDGPNGRIVADLVVVGKQFKRKP